MLSRGARNSPHLPSSARMQAAVLPAPPPRCTKLRSKTAQISMWFQHQTLLLKPLAHRTTAAAPLARFRHASPSVHPNLQLETYFWSMKLHRNTDRLSARQRAWVKHLLTVRSRIRLHWKPVNKGPRSVSCTPTPEHPPLPRVMNDIWLLVLKFVTLAELGDLNT